MTTLETILYTLRGLKPELSDKYGVSSIGLFGSVVRDDFKIQYPEIDWRRIKGFRNRIVHEYFGIDYEIVWKIKETFLPEILKKLLSIK